MYDEPELRLEEWQVRVDVFRDVVVKYPKSEQEIAAFLVDRYREDPEQAAALGRTLHAAFRRGSALIRGSCLPRHLVGDPVFRSDGSYVQRRVVPCGAFLDAAAPDASRHEAAHRVLDGWFDLVDTLWRAGLHEETTNLGCNAGIDGEGRVVLFDFGEMMDDPKRIRAELVSERWRRSASFTKEIPSCFRDAYATRAEGRFTVARFDSLWRSGEGGRGRPVPPVAA